ncbi:MAG TPA: thioredoxin-dependent thiol peroxidase [Bryobacteraceae bacterium]|nr:thioredoxin-dependent thiol peroxidase [Bryobacteraceae bacterium]
MELTEGAPAPDIQLQTDSCEPFSLSDHRGRKVVLYFYPRASTPGCTTEACEFRDAGDELDVRGALVVGISPDSTEAQARFKRAQHLRFPLLADVDKQAAQAYGVWKEKNMYGKKFWGVERTTFVIDEDGRIAKIFRKVKPKGHAAEVLQTL